ncbi:GNAT family N-acetyltransferase [Lysobacter sp. CA199]|uniref:GNAT family N-acetyltransferase n=1 Tax=Lysobacter sp. CA199 TaxID=3455608 RepID=UPI003F8D504B
MDEGADAHDSEPSPTGPLRISREPGDLDFAAIHDFLARQSYWAAGIPEATLRRALQHSICCSGHIGGQMVAFARAITDQATFAYLADVFVAPAQRGHGHGRAVVAALMADPRLQGLRRWHLVTRDMQALYAQVGFSELSQPGQHMQKHDPDVYLRRSSMQDTQPEVAPQP